MDVEYNQKEEIENVVEEVSRKYGYSDDLKQTLKKLALVMLRGRSYEEKQVFYEMLETTPIAVIMQGSTTTRDEIKNQMIGNPNPHIIDKETKKSEYDKKRDLSAGEFVTEPVLDKDLKVVGAKKFLYITSIDTSRELSEKDKRYVEKFGTGINVSHLAHELGHAWVSQKNPYSIEDGILTQRMGTAEIKYRIDSLEDGRYVAERISSKGIMLEEGLNSEFEEQTMADFLSISREELQSIYDSGEYFTPSVYQSSILHLVQRMCSLKGVKKDLGQYRMFGDKESKDRVNEKLSKTNYYEKRSKLYEKLEGDLGEENENEGLVTSRNRILRKLLSGPNGARLNESIATFFPDTENMSPLDMVDNILTEFYNINAQKYSIKFEDYQKLMLAFSREGYGMMKQAEEYLGKEEQVEK